MAVWCTVLTELQSFLVENKVAKIIECGAMLPDDYNFSIDKNGLQGGIFLIRDREYNQEIKNMHGGRQGLITIFAENWVRSDDVNPLVGYNLLSAQEDRFQQCLKDWVVNRINNESETFSIIDAEIEEVIGDADSKRPLVGSRTTIKITYSIN